MSSCLNEEDHKWFNQVIGLYLHDDALAIHEIETRFHSDTAEAPKTSSVCELRFNNFETFIEAYP